MPIGGLRGREICNPSHKTERIGDPLKWGTQHHMEPYRGSYGVGVMGCPIGVLRGTDVPPPAPKQRTGDPPKMGHSAPVHVQPYGGQGCGAGGEGLPHRGPKVPHRELGRREIQNPSPKTERIGDPNKMRQTGLWGAL